MCSFRVLLLGLIVLTACSDGPSPANAAGSDIAAQLDPNEKFGDFTRAERWYLHFHLPGINDGINKRFEVIEPLMEAGDLHAVKKFARAYSGGTGPMGGPQDFEKSFALYRQAAERGDTAAMTSLGYMYMRGTGTEKNHREALNWLEKAYEATGDTGAARGIAWIYAGYDGSEMKNPGKAAKWKDRARQQVENRTAFNQQVRAEKQALQTALTGGIDSGESVLRRFHESQFALIEKDARRNVPEAVSKLASIKLGNDVYWLQTGSTDLVDPVRGMALLEQYYGMVDEAGRRALVARHLADLYGSKGPHEIRDPEKEALWRKRAE